jgi:hypothetical protein
VTADSAPYCGFQASRARAERIPREADPLCRPSRSLKSGGDFGISSLRSGLHGRSPFMGAW